MWTEGILHVDMDAFFVEVERLADASLLGKPVAVGGTGKRGVIASASYEARAFGIHSAQPTGEALRLCPTLRLVPPRHRRYTAVSQGVFDVLRSFTPLVEGLSLDEAFLDVSGLRHHYDAPMEVAGEVRAGIRSELGLPCSVGIAATKFVAKLASEAAKPDGILHVPLDSQEDFLRPLPVAALWGVGPATLAGLKRLGIETVGDLADVPETALATAMGSGQAAHLLSLARGEDPRPVKPDSEARSISVEETFETDIEDVEVLAAVLLGQAQRLADRLRRSGLAARTITLKVRYPDFTTVTRSISLAGAVDSPRDIYLTGKSLLVALEDAGAVRLLGLAGTNLETGDGLGQMNLEHSQEWRRVADAVDEVRRRFGNHSVEPARLLENKGGQSEADR